MQSGYAFIALLTSAAPPVPVSNEPEEPRLCVIVERSDAAAQPLAAAELAAALAGRLGRQQLGVELCRDADASSWRVAVDWLAPEVLQLSISGTGLAAEHRLDLAELGRDELVALLANTAVEELRAPVDDALLARFGYITEVAPLSAAASACQPCSPPPEPEPLRRRLSLLVGPYLRGGWQPTLTGELAGAVGSERWLALGHVAGRPLEGRSDAARLRGGEAEIGVGAAWVNGAFELGLRAQSRVAIVQAKRQERRAFWDAGLAATAGVRLLVVAPVEVGLATHLAAWSQPRRFLVGGEPLASQGTLELGALVALRAPL